MEARPRRGRDGQRDDQLRWLKQSEAGAVESELSLLLSETRGVCEKLASTSCGLLTHQLVLWQPRWLYAEIDGICYQKVSVSEKPVGPPKKLPFATVSEIIELDCSEFVVVTTSARGYRRVEKSTTFKAVDELACEVLVHNLTQLLAYYRERIDYRQRLARSEDD